MALSAFTDTVRGKTAEAFSVVAAAVLSIPMTPVIPLDTKKPGPHIAQDQIVSATTNRVDRGIGALFAQRQEAINQHGLVQYDKSADLLNPVKDGAMMAVASVIPAFGPVAFGLLAGNVYRYYESERKGSPSSNDYGYVTQTSETARQTRWNQPGFHDLSPTNDDENPVLSDAEKEALLRPAKETPEMKVLFAQQQHLAGASANLRIREEKGLPRNADSLEAALEQDNLGWADQQNSPAPAFL